MKLDEKEQMQAVTVAQFRQLMAPAVSLPIQSVGLWRRSLERMPEPGQLIVKRWDHNRAVWAGVYSGSPKDGSFDEWCALATPHQGSDGGAE